jgi:hypothetical protein
VVIFDDCEYEYAAAPETIIPNIMNIINRLNFERYDKLIHSRYRCHHLYLIHTKTIADVRIHVSHNIAM